MTKRIENEIWRVADLVPYAKNAKKHSDEQVEKLAGLIDKHGWTQPIVIAGDEVDDQPRGSIIAGHGRRLAAIKLGREKVPVRVIYGFSKTEVDALRLADNRVTSIHYDDDLLKEELALLTDAGLDMIEFGFTEKEIEFSTEDLGEIDATMFEDDITGAVERQAEENKSAADAADDAATPVGEALGFKRVSVAQSRVIRSFIARIEHQTGQKGAEALLAFIAEQEAA